nr:piggyBac transposable element-derived protein 4-like [Nomia melanderi]XP_031830868.1 piggyBac transposable element-derived protein 4-like [Nomia melanderi]XP_031830869.1 piggyBac transposable element-derived protein 4-like [Nomia melanderi]
MTNEEETFLWENYEDCLSDVPSNYENCDALSDSDFNSFSDSDLEDLTLNNKKRSHILQTQSSDSEEKDDNPLEWSDDDSPRNNEPFEGSPGIKIWPIYGESIEQVAKLYFTDDLFQIIVTETNKYYAKNSYKYRTSKSTGKWTELTIPELKKWFGLIIIMGLIRKGKLIDYWSTNPVIETPIFSKVMSRNRFRQILSCLHFSDNDNMPGNADRLFKIQPIVNHFKQKFNDVYKPMQKLLLEEDIIPWRGRLNFQVYNPFKITKYGILIRMLCESSTGYVCNFDIYSDTKSLESTISALVSNVSNMWYHIYMDNYYNSVEIAKQLLLKKIKVCGTIRANRGLPSSLKKSKLNMFETRFKRQGEILIQLWKTDKKKDIRMISTIHNSDVINTGIINRKTGQHIQKPKCIIDYDQHMKGVDRADRYIACYPIFRKTRKWTKKVALYLFNCGLFNAFKVYRNINRNSKLKYKEFLENIATAWIEDKTVLESEPNLDSPSISGTSSVTRTPRFDSLQRFSGDLRQHHLVKIAGMSKRIRRRCKVCYLNKIRKETSYMCKHCKVPLHIGECFNSYHLKEH